ncbi:hypothetical protein EIN_134600, partial [Entamoeba invadens IP1]
MIGRVDTVFAQYTENFFSIKKTIEKLRQTGKTQMKSKMTFFVSTLLVILSMSKTLYVDQTLGSDELDGSSESRPFKTIQACVATLSQTTVPSEGLTIRIAPGNYSVPEKIVIDQWRFKGISDTNKVTITSYPNKEKPVLTGGINIPMKSFRSMSSTTDAMYAKIQEKIRSKVKVVELTKLNISSMTMDT